MIALIPIEKDMPLSSLTEEPEKSHLKMTLDYYDMIGFVPPWISYWVTFQGQTVGICAFKGAPVDNRVEIAYCTFPPYEGRGFAAKACEQLVRIAQSENQSLTVIAHTLPEENASTTILKKNGFTFAGTVIDPDDGEVFEWIFSHSHIV